MKYKVNYLLILILLIAPLILTVNSYASIDAIDQIEKQAESMEGISIISQTALLNVFNLKTHFKSGETSIFFSPSYFDVKKVVDEDEVTKTFTITGNELTGRALSVSVNHSISESFIVFAAFTDVTINGTMDVYYKNKLTYPSSTVYEYSIELDHTSRSILIGAGWDFIGKVRDVLKTEFSIPLYYGLSYNYHSYSGDVSPDSDNTTLPYVKLSAEDSLWGMFFGVGFSYRFINSIYVTAYNMYNMTFGSPEIKAEVVKDNDAGPDSSAEVGYTMVRNTNKSFFPQLGINVTYKSDFPFEVSFGISGLVNEYNPLMKFWNNGLEVTIYQLSVAYNF